MSAKKFESGDSFQQQITVEGRQSRLELSSEAVVIHKSGIEFRSPTPFNPWTEMTVALQSPRDDCSATVISVHGLNGVGLRNSMPLL